MWQFRFSGPNQCHEFDLLVALAVLEVDLDGQEMQFDRVEFGAVVALGNQFCAAARRT